MPWDELQSQLGTGEVVQGFVRRLRASLIAEPISPLSAIKSLSSMEGQSQATFCDQLGAAEKAAMLLHAADIAEEREACRELQLARCRSAGLRGFMQLERMTSELLG